MTELSALLDSYTPTAAAATAAGTDARVVAQDGGVTSGAGGNVLVQSGTATSGNGGNITLAPGTASGSGTDGHVICLLAEYPDNDEAYAGGVPGGGLYRTGNEVKVVTAPVFGAAADRVNMLHPAFQEWQNASQSVINDDITLAANESSEWTPGNPAHDAFGATGPNVVTFGGTISFGSFTATKIVEAVTGSVAHYVTAGFELTPNKKLRYTLAVVAKAGERTRIQLEAANGGGGGHVFARNYGARCTFDLATGTVAIAGAGYAPVGYEEFAFTAVTGTVEALGGGWYICKLDFTTIDAATGWMGSVLCWITLDNAAGTAASSTTYAGDGSSGLYVGRTTLLPTRAFELTSRTFYDDFNSDSTIDRLDTRAAGFKWYPHLRWPMILDTTIPDGDFTPSTYYTVVGSILNLNRQNSTWNTSLTTAAWDGGTGYVGQVFQLPAMFETRAQLGPLIFEGGNDGRIAFWTASMEQWLAPHHWDAHEDGMNGYSPQGTPATTVAAAAGTRVLTFAHVPEALARVGAIVYNNTNPTSIPNLTKITSRTTTTITLDKDIGAPGVSSGDLIRFHWNVEVDFYEREVGFRDGDHNYHLNMHSLPGLAPADAGIVIGSGGEQGIRAEVFNTLAYLWIPATEDEHGCVLPFVNGALASRNAVVYGRNFDPGVGFAGFTEGDDKHYALQLGGGGLSAKSPAKHDWVAIYEAGTSS